MTEKGTAMLAVVVIALLGAAHSAYGYWTDRIGVQEEFAVVWPVEVELEEETEEKTQEGEEENGKETEKKAETGKEMEKEKGKEAEKESEKDRAGEAEPEEAEPTGLSETGPET